MCGTTPSLLEGVVGSELRSAEVVLCCSAELVRKSCRLARNLCGRHSGPVARKSLSPTRSVMTQRLLELTQQDRLASNAIRLSGSEPQQDRRDDNCNQRHHRKEHGCAERW